MANIIDIRTVDINSIPQNEIFAVDTNVLLWACYNNTANNPYSKNQFASKRVKTLYRIWDEEDFKENATELKCFSQL